MIEELFAVAATLSKEPRIEQERVPNHENI
jgi:hypothetical protein